MRLLALSFISVLAVVCAGCDGNPCKTVCDGDGPAGIMMFDDMHSITLLTDAATITQIDIAGDILHLTVTYSGGCRDHEFELYGWTAFLESEPPQAQIYLSHDANGDVCEAIITEYLEFDLVPLKQAYRRMYHDEGSVLLRIHEPGAELPVQPLPLYEC